MFKRLLVSQIVDRLNEPRRFIQIVAGLYNIESLMWILIIAILGLNQTTCSG